MKIFMLVLFFATFALCQNSTNPQGFPYFSPTVVKELLLNSTVSSLFTNQTLSEFYYVWVPQNVGSIRYTFSSTGDLCDTDLGALINVIEATGSTPDYSLGFPCLAPQTGLFCAGWESLLIGSGSAVFSLGGGLSPGQYQYVSVMTDFVTIECSYNLTVEVLFECPDHQVPVYSGPLTCVDVTNVTNGQVVTNTTESADQVDVYRFLVPQNVSRIWVGLTSNTSNALFMNGVGYAVTNPQHNLFGASDLGYNATTGLYYWVTEIVLPYGDYPAYFAVGSDTDPISYELSFYWSYCGANSTGLGIALYSPSSELIDFPIPDCSHPYTYNQLPVVNGTYSLSVPAQNPVTQEPGANFIAFSVPVETVGSIQIMCESTFASTYFNLAHNQLTSCDSSFFSCDDNSAFFLSEELWMGGQWSIVVCNTNYTVSDSVTIYVTAFGATPSPGASASPSSPAEHSSGASKMLPVLLFVFLIAAALVQV